jgi:hypothetical protein
MGFRGCYCFVDLREGEGGETETESHGLFYSSSIALSSGSSEGSETSSVTRCAVRVCPTNVPNAAIRLVSDHAVRQRVNLVFRMILCVSAY